MAAESTMTQHYTRNTAEVSHYCPTCNRQTMHRVDDRRLGVCLEHAAAGRSLSQIRQQEKREQEKQQPGLF